MNFIPGDIYHIFNQGNNRQTVFFKDEHYLKFLQLLRRGVAPNCTILAWCLMPNHFHLMVQATERSCAETPAYGGKPMQQLANRLGILLSTYAQQINKEEGRSGSIFRQRTKANPVSKMMEELKFSGSLSEYLISLMHYIHQNPLRAGLADKLEDWRFSSFQDYAGLRNGTLCHRQLLMEMTGYNPETFYTDSYNAIIR